MRYQAKTAKLCRPTKAEESADHDHGRHERHDEADREHRRVRRGERTASSSPDRTRVAANITGMARKNENSVAARAGEAERIAAHDTWRRSGRCPGMSESTCARPMPERGAGRHAATVVRSSRAGAQYSISRMTMPPTTSAAATTAGRNSSLLDPVVRQEPDDRGRQKCNQNSFRENRRLRGSRSRPQRTTCHSRVRYSHTIARMAPSWMKMSKVLARSSRESQPAARDDQMPRGRDRDELGYALDQAQHGRLPQQLTRGSHQHHASTSR